MECSESKTLIKITALKRISQIFLGPFLVAYFIKTSETSLFSLSTYNILSYMTLGLLGFIIGHFINNGFKIGMFRIGVIINAIYLLVIIILREDILNYLWLIAFLYGTSTCTYYLPYNIFVADKVPHDERPSFEVKCRTDDYLISIFVPILLGSLITTTNYIVTGFIVFLISLVQIGLTFKLKPIPKSVDNFTVLKSWKNLMKHKEVKKSLFCDFFRGLTISDSSLSIIITILVINAFKTDLNLGIITSISSLLALIISYIYIKKNKSQDDKIVILLCCIAPIISVILLMILKSNVMILIYNLIYNVLIGLMALIINIRVFNLSKSKEVSHSNQVEFWVIREFFICSGRLLSHIGLFLIAIFYQEIYLNYLLVLLTLAIVAMGILTMNIKKY